MNNIFLDETWQKKHLKWIKQIAGPRYSSELNIDLPISKIFDAISRNQDFYSKIQRHLHDITQAFSSFLKNSGDMLEENILACQESVNLFQEKFKKISKYDVKIIPWEEIRDQSFQLNKVMDHVAGIIKLQIDDLEKSNQQDISLFRTISESLKIARKSLFDIRSYLVHFIERTSIVYYDLSNKPMLFLHGDTGAGKTHLLCDLVGNCFDKEKVLPAVLVFGENFKTTEDPFIQIVRQLKLELGREEFFKFLNEASKKSKCRALLIIDALSETPVPGYWIENLSVLVNKIKDFPNIALIVSCRHGFEREILSEKLTENFIFQEHKGFVFKEWEAVNKFFHYFKIPFQKFSDHLIGRYIFKAYEKEFGKENKNLKTAKRFFSTRERLGRFLSCSQNQGLIEALSIQCPEQLKGYDLIQVAPYLKKNYITPYAFIESIIWRKVSAFPQDLKEIKRYINTKIIINKELHDELLNAFLAVTAVPGHPFNAKFLHEHLLKISMAKRDAWWSIFLHGQHSEYSSVDRLIDWAWSMQNKDHISNEAIRLCSLALCWFFTASNRFVRDKATKAVVTLLANKLDIVLEILQKFQYVNDPYVAERVYAIAYGSAMKSIDGSNKENLKNLALWVYKNIFKNNNPPVHILLRDYAKGIVEVALQRQILLQINVNSIRPPYNSEWIRDIPSKESINELKAVDDVNIVTPYTSPINIILFSMRIQGGLANYGDFGRYVFESALNHFDYSQEVNVEELSNWAIKRIITLGYDVKLHGEFDIRMNHDPYGRSEHKPERIGKKYQWIALYELLARVSDRFELKDIWAGISGKYEGPWQLTIRDIDPSCTLTESHDAYYLEIPYFNNYNKKFK